MQKLGDGVLKKTSWWHHGTNNRRRKWRFVGHILRKNSTSISRTGLFWTPEGKRKRGRPRATWRRTSEKGVGRSGGVSWAIAKKMAQDRGLTIMTMKSLTDAFGSRLHKIMHTGKTFSAISTTDFYYSSKRGQAVKVISDTGMYFNSCKN